MARCMSSIFCPVAFAGTPFQNKVWYALRAIPAGETLSYGAPRQTHWQAQSRACSGPRQRFKPYWPRRALSSHHRQRWIVEQATAAAWKRKRWLLAHEAHHAGAGLFRKEISA